MTHFDKLVEYLNTFPNVKQLFIDTSMGNGRRIVEGQHTLHYNPINLLRQLSFPDKMIDYISDNLLKVRVNG